MRLFVDKYNHKVWIAASASTRCELAQKLSDKISIKIDDVWHTFNIDEVCAEPAGRLDIAFMMIGGLVGLVGGPFGALLGALGGYLWGFNEDAKEKRKVKTFNEGHIGGRYDAPNE